MADAVPQNPVVNSFNEWDPLEEIIVGVLDGMGAGDFELMSYGYIPEDQRDKAREESFGQTSNRRVAPPAAHQELAEFVRVLEGEGVTVRRPDPIDNSRPYMTPDWVCSAGTAQTCPRDVMTVVGDEIIESPMSQRSRYFEFRAYRRLIKDYFAKGARWTQAPKPQMTNELYKNLYYEKNRDGQFVTTEFEPVFDAADIIRCGKDLFVQRSHVTNEGGIEWLRRHLGPTYNVHRVEFADYRAVHIDATFVPLAPGKVLVNPDRPIKEWPECFKKAGWEVLVPPRTTWPRSDPEYVKFEWLLLNVLMLDEQRVIVEKHEEPFIRAMKEWGFKPIPVAFRNVMDFGGAFHCFTCDIRRRGGLQSYF